MQRGRESWEPLVHIFVLFGFAVAQPLFDLLARQAEFFAARRSQPSDIIFLVVLLCIGVPALIASVEIAIGRISSRVRARVHLCVIAILCAVLVLQMLRTSDLAGAILVSGAGASGVLIALSYRRFLPVRQFLTVLTPAILIFPVIFLSSSPVAKMIFPEGTAEIASIKFNNPPPIVMVIFDEFPLTSLLDEERRIDAIRYPHFAALAQEATWFRNATSVSSATLVAVPTILSGNYPDRFRMPTVADYPRSLFTLLGRVYKFKVFETRTQLCPEELCGRGIIRQAPFKKRVETLLSDLSIVYLHLLLPSEWRTRLPDVSQDWMNFATGKATHDQQNDRSRLNHWLKRIYLDSPQGRPQQFLHFVNTLQPTEHPTLYFLHVLLPHIPYIWLPSGKRYSAEVDIPGLEREQWTTDEWAVTQGYQRSLLQVGFIDALLGKLVAHLKSLDLYDRSLLVITADHGASFRPGDFRRPLTATNYQDIMPIPLLIKAPYQHKGILSDRNVETIDILPTIVDILDISLPWSTDGQSALDPSLPERSYKTIFKNIFDAQEQFTCAATVGAASTVLEKKLTIFGSGRTRPNGLFAVGPYRRLVGQNVNDVSLIGKTPLPVEIDQARLLANVAPHNEFLPAHLTGRVTLKGGEATPQHLAIAINGTIQAVTRTWSFPVNGEHGHWSAVLNERAFRPGMNKVEVFLLPSGDRTPLFPSD